MSDERADDDDEVRLGIYIYTRKKVNVITYIIFSRVGNTPTRPEDHHRSPDQQSTSIGSKRPDSWLHY
jgi:hypothetical protein